jgi:integrase
MIRRNPCRIKGAGQERSPERPVLTVGQVYALVDAIGGRYRTLVLLAVFGSLRWGELTGLRRSDIDIQAHTVRVFQQLREQRGGGFAFGPPKSDAGYRTVAIPDMIMPDLASHIVTYAALGKRRVCVHQFAGHAIAAQQLHPPGLAASVECRWAADDPFSRSAPWR